MNGLKPNNQHFNFHLQHANANNTRLFKITKQSTFRSACVSDIHDRLEEKRYCIVLCVVWFYTLIVALNF